MEGVNIYFEMQLDEDQILSDGVYDLDKLYACMDETFAAQGCYLEKIEGTKRVYTRNIDNHDLERLMMCASEIEDTKWFEKYACCYMFYIYDEGALDTEEDWLEEADIPLRRSFRSGVKEILCQMRAYKNDGIHFLTEESKRSDFIKSLLGDTSYQCIEEEDFILFHKKDLCDYQDGMRLISVNIDVDTRVVIASLICLMQKNELPDSVMAAFIKNADKERQGIKKLVKLLKKVNSNFRAIVLDVTNTGWEEECVYTVENCYLKKTMYKNLIHILHGGNGRGKWKIIPEDKQMLKGILFSDDYFTTNESIKNDCDYYQECGVNCFSLCFPVEGRFGTAEGVKIRFHSLGWYIYKLIQLAKGKI